MKSRLGTVGLVLGLASAPNWYPAYAQEEAVVDSSRQSRKHLSFGARYFRNNSFDDAETQLSKSISFNPAEGRAHYYLARVYHETDRYEEALETFDAAITHLKSSSPSYVNSIVFKAQIYQLIDDRPNAISAYERLLDLDPKPEQRIQYLHFIVSLNAEENEYESALEYARLWGEADPDNPEVRDMIAKLALHTGSADEALAEKEKVLEMNPNDWETLEWLGNQYKTREYYDKAFDAFARLHSHDPTNFVFLDNLLELSNHAGRGDRYRIGLLTKMNEMQPQNLRVLEMLADKTGSLSWINAGLKIDTRSGRLNYLKGDYYFKQWKSDGAKQDSVRALTWYKKAKSDLQWQDNAQRMIWELDPPLTKEEKAKRRFFNEAKNKKEEVQVKGKK